MNQKQANKLMQHYQTTVENINIIDSLLIDNKMKLHQKYITIQDYQNEQKKLKLVRSQLEYLKRSFFHALPFEIKENLNQKGGFIHAYA